VIIGNREGVALEFMDNLVIKIIELHGIKALQDNLEDKKIFE
jgi:hypothetical protein